MRVNSIGLTDHDVSDWPVVSCTSLSLDDIPFERRIKCLHGFEKRKKKGGSYQVSELRRLRHTFSRQLEIQFELEFNHLNNTLKMLLDILRKVMSPKCQMIMEREKKKEMSFLV